MEKEDWDTYAAIWRDPVPGGPGKMFRISKTGRNVRAENSGEKVGNHRS